MGGFQLYDGVMSMYPLDLKRIDELVSEGRIDFPAISRREIEDRSKGDILSKGLVILQTGWFILQIISRSVQHLPITELEIATVAFSTLNFITYALWWNKPLRVDCPVRVQLKSNPKAEIRQSLIKQDDLFVYYFDTIFGKDPVDLKHCDAVPTFHARGRDSISNGDVAYTVETVVGTIFGAIHCMAWSFQFPSREEQFLWRICSIGVTAAPTCLLLLSLEWTSSYIHVIIRRSGAALVTLTYVICRVFLLALMFTELRSLPEGALQSVYWTSFIPHL